MPNRDVQRKFYRTLLQWEFASSVAALYGDRYGYKDLRGYGAGQRCSIIARSSSAISFPSPTHASFMRMWVVAGMSNVRRFIGTFGAGGGPCNSFATAAGGVGAATAAGGS